MNVPAILFLLGLSPNPQGTPEIAKEWNELSGDEKKAVIRQFETEYKVDVKTLNYDDYSNLPRNYNMRSWDQRGD